MSRRLLPSDRLPKGTRLHLVVLLRRCRQLAAADVDLPRASVEALARTVDYLAATHVEGRSA